MAINAALPIIKGHKLRATRVGRCGLPLPGPRNTFVTKGFIEFQLERETSDGDDIEMKNASGEVCATDRTDDQFKRYNLTLSLCGIHPEFLNLMTDQAMVTGADGEVDGILTQTGGSGNASFALELWAGTGGGDDCEAPDDDAIFDTIEGGEAWEGWYLLLPWVRGAVLGDLTVNGTDAAEINVTAYTGAGAHWGRGPYNVVEGADGEAGRLNAPIPQRTHMLLQRTTVKPPKETNGLQQLTLPQPYFGANAVDKGESVPTEAPGNAGAAGGDDDTASGVEGES